MDGDTQKLPSLLYYFHVTPVENATSILLHGLDPRVKYPARKDTKTWFVRESWVAWAIAHVSARHKVSADKLAVFRHEITAYTQPTFNRQGNPSGLYYTWMTGLCMDQLPVSAEYALMVIAREESLGLDEVWS